MERTLRLKHDRPGMKVVVAGCLVERSGTELPPRFPAVDLWVSLKDIARIPILLGDRRHCGPAGRILSTPPHFAYLRIADGCDNCCSYCMIPSIRGSLRSRPMADVLREARSLAQAGVKELVLVAQDTTAYGRDTTGKPLLARLLRRLAAVDGVRWLRLMYTHPTHITEDVIAELAANPKVCRYVDVPLQHVSTRILKRMNRPYRRENVERLLARLRLIPDLAIRTTLIVGFPGETDAEFSELLDFVRTTRINRLSAYAYSAEPGTRAARLGAAVPPEVKRERVRELMKTQARVSRALLRRLVGRQLTVLVDQPGLGRTQWDAPEVDGVVRLTGRKVQPGRLTRAVVTGSSTHDLTARC